MEEAQLPGLKVNLLFTFFSPFYLSLYCPDHLAKLGAAGYPTTLIVLTD